MNGAAALVAAASVGAQDTTAIRVPGHPGVADSTVDVTLLPDVITPIIQWIFQKPPWVMWGGAVLAVLVAAAVLWWLRGNIARIFHYLRTRSGAVKGVMGAAVLLVVLATVAAGMKAYDFTMNDKRFCNGCHIFVPSGQVVERPDSGNYTLVNRMEGKHDTLNCHTCHAFHPQKEAVKMVLWMSGVRDSTIPEHGKVPRDVCEKCHEQGAAKETWQAIAKTAGHRTHFESDSTRSRARWSASPATPARPIASCRWTVPAPRRDAISPTTSSIKLGKMAGQTGLHCIVCHQFTRVVPGLATFDSAKGTLVPGSKQCFSCHAMRERLQEFDPGEGPAQRHLRHVPQPA